MRVYEYIERTLANFFKIGDVTINANSGVAEIKNPDNTALAKLRAADPVGDTDVATKGWATANLGAANAVRETALTFDDTDLADTGTVTIDTNDLPTGAVVQSIDVKVEEAFNGGASVLVGTAADDDLFITAGQLDPTNDAGVQSFNLRSAAFGSAGPVQFTVATTGTPDAGSLTAWITYSVPSVVV